MLTPSQSGSLDLPSPPQISCVCSYTPLNFHERLRRPGSQGPSCLLCSLIFRLSSSSAFCFISQLLFVLKIRTVSLNVDKMDKKIDEKLQQLAWVLLVNSLNAEANYEWERIRQKKTTLENKIFIILLYFWRTLIDHIADMMRVSIKLNVKCVSLQFQTQWDEKTDEIDRETNSVFCFSLCVLRYSYCYSEMWQIVELAVTSDSATQHCRFPLAASHHLCFFSFFSSFPLRIYYADRHTLRICSASLVKQGSDWMMPGCRSSALLKSIFPAAALALASVLLSLDGFLFLSFLTRLTSWTSLAGCL